MITTLAILCCAILAALAVFQAALIFGVPLGKFAWGGEHRVLPANLRFASVVAILLYGFIALMLLSKAGLIAMFDNQHVVDVIVWIIAGYFTLGIVMNAISRSKYERALMTPVVSLLAILCICIALS